MAVVFLKKKHDGFLKYRHPWIFSGAVARVEGDPGPGDTVEVRTHEGASVGSGAFSPRSQITVRMWSFDPEEPIDAAFFRQRLQRALGGRHLNRFDEEGGAARLVFSESDGLPGFIVDRYGAFLVCQFLSAGAEAWRRTFVDLLQELVGPRGIYERSDGEVRDQEGLERRTGLVAGEEPPEYIEIDEDGRRYLVDVRAGHKTGFYLDQRENRRRLAEFMAGREVLDCFCYTGGFAVAALQAGAASVVSVDSSGPALEQACRNIAINGFGSGRSERVEAKVGDYLRRCRDSGRQFDLVVLDPPKFIHGAAHLKQGSRGYKDINMLGLKLLAPGGVLVTFSCSQLMTPELFQRVVSYAATDTGRQVQILKHLEQAPDHPVALNFPEGHYLKGLACRVW